MRGKTKRSFGKLNREGRDKKCDIKEKLEKANVFSNLERWWCCHLGPPLSISKFIISSNRFPCLLISLLPSNPIATSNFALTFCPKGVTHYLWVVSRPGRRLVSNTNYRSKMITVQTGYWSSFNYDSD